jgi:RNA polymerase sigma-70 factor (family 1)
MSIVKGIFTSQSHSDEAISFDALFSEFYNRLVYFSFQFVNDKHQAQDIVQEAFIKYWNQHQTILPDKIAIKNFLYSTVRNASLNIIRHQKVVEGYVQLQGGIEPSEPSIMEAIIAAEVMAGVHAAVQSLPANYRLISEMGYLEGKKNQEIADELDMSVNTVKKQKQRALQLMRMKLTPEMFTLLFALTALVYR